MPLKTRSKKADIEEQIRTLMAILIEVKAKMKAVQNEMNVGQHNINMKVAQEYRYDCTIGLVQKGEAKIIELFY